MMQCSCNLLAAGWNCTAGSKCSCKGSSPQMMLSYCQANHCAHSALHKHL